MKTIFLFLFLIGYFVGAVAQSLEVKPMPKIDFNKGWPKENLLTFNNSSSLNSVNPVRDLNFSQRIPQLQDERKVPGFPTEISKAYQLRMPVVRGSFYSPMPVVVPDPNVHYFLKPIFGLQVFQAESLR